MKRALTRGGLAAATLLTAWGAAPRAARAQQDFASEASLVEGDDAGGNRYRSPQRFAYELTFGPYRPDIDSEFNGARAPYADYFGSGDHLLIRTELDYQFWHRYGSIAAGLGLGYFSVTGTAPVASGTGLASGDKSQLKIVPLSLSAVYRFDYLLQTVNFPARPLRQDRARLGLLAEHRRHGQHRHRRRGPRPRRHLGVARGGRRGADARLPRPRRRP